MCLSIGTPKNNKFSICSKRKIHYFQVSQILGIVRPFETNGKLMRLGVPILKHFRVLQRMSWCWVSDVFLFLDIPHRKIGLCHSKIF